MSNPKHSRTWLTKSASASVKFIVFAVVFALLIFTFTIIINSFGPPGQPNNLAILVAAVLTITAAIIAIIQLVLTALQIKTLKSKSTELKELTEQTVITRDISTRFRLQTAEETSNELLSVERRRLELEKQKIQLEREQQTIGWQKEALAVVQVSPRSAIVIAWIGVEQELNHIARRPNLLSQLRTNIAQPSSIINALNEADYINQHELEMLKQMQEVRNKVVHGVEESVPSTEEAISYVQDAINITQKLASIEE